MTPDGCGIENPAFDVTPAKYVTAIITERGLLRAPYADSIAAMDRLIPRPKHTTEYLQNTTEKNVDAMAREADVVAV